MRFVSLTLYPHFIIALFLLDGIISHIKQSLLPPHLTLKCQILCLFVCSIKSFVFCFQVKPVFVVYMVTGIEASIAILKAEIGKSKFCFCP